MSKTRGNREVSGACDSSVNVSVGKTGEPTKKKVARIHDVFPDIQKEVLSKILLFYNEDESQAIDAIYRDGGEEALSNWADAEKIKKNNKNKRRKKKPKKDVAGIAATASFDADDSSSLHSGGNIDVEVEKNNVEENGDMIVKNEDKDAHANVYERLNINTENVDVEVRNKTSPDTKFAQKSKTSLTETAPLISSNKTDSENAARGSPLSDSTDENSEKKEKFRSAIDTHHKHSPRQRTSSFRRSKSSTSEDTSSQHNPQAAATPTKRGYEKCKKDLNRQSISLQRIQAQLEKALEDSDKKVKQVFSDLHKMLESRQKEVEVQLQNTKLEALNLVKSRQDLGTDLKRKVDRSGLTEADWSELRSDIKQFVTERKYDDDLGKTIWFQWSDLSEIIKSFGEVQPVKNVYSQRSHSVPANREASNHPEPASPTSSVANEEVDSSTDKRDIPTHVQNAPAPEKEDPIPPGKSLPGENRTRIYSNTNLKHNNFNNAPYNMNRGGGSYRRGNDGYNRPPRGYNNSNSNSMRPPNYKYYPRNDGYYDYDYRNTPRQDYRERGNFSAERGGARAEHHHRGQRRPQNLYHRGHQGPFRGGSYNSGPRHKSAGVGESQGAGDGSSVGGKTGAVNGYVKEGNEE